MFKGLDIQEQMEVVGSDGKHVGTVDHKEPDDRIVLTKDDPKAGGHRHLISIDWVEYVDRKVHLNKPSQKAMLEWRRPPEPSPFEKSPATLSAGLRHLGARTMKP